MSCWQISAPISRSTLSSSHSIASSFIEVGIPTASRHSHRQYSPSTASQFQPTGLLNGSSHSSSKPNLLLTSLSGYWSPWLQQLVTLYEHPCLPLYLVVAEQVQSYKFIQNCFCVSSINYNKNVTIKLKLNYLQDNLIKFWYMESSYQPQDVPYRQMSSGNWTI